MKIIEHQKVEVTVRRPDGKVEILIHPHIDYMTDGVRDNVNKAMKDANRGEVISYRNIPAVTEMEESDYQVKCERCGKHLDSRKAFSQLEWSYFNSHRVQVKTYYCDSCKQLLSAIGAGEHTALEDRKTLSVNEPYEKGDN
jgi:Zn finger protein HypA/HybF involved in hydrogenase expression